MNFVMNNKKELIAKISEHKNYIKKMMKGPLQPDIFS